MPYRILYVGELFNGSTVNQRGRALRELGCETIDYSVMPYRSAPNRLMRALAHRTGWGPPVWRLNRDLLAFSANVEYDAVWIDKGLWVYPETLRRLRRSDATRLVHYTPDSHFICTHSRHFDRSVPEYDVLITTKRYELDIYRRRGARMLHFQYQGYDPSLFRPVELTAEETSRFACDLVFIGRCEPHYVQCVRAATEVCDSVAVWGQWERLSKRQSWLDGVFRGSGVWGADYPKALCGAKVALGLLAKSWPDQSTTRTFEIPACGTFLLAERTDEHLELYEEGREAEFFGDTDELKDKIRYYLAHDEARTRIAAAGRQRCLTSGYTYRDRMRECLEVLKQTGVAVPIP